MTVYQYPNYLMHHGVKGMYVDPISQFHGEHEFILQRNSSFKIVDYVANGNGTITDVIVELIDQTV
nr:MAG TPA: ADP-ribosyltransferase exoenzyme [Caudoviricetes sp.]